MNIFWPGFFLLVCGIIIFLVVILRPDFLKSVRRARSKYHVSPLGATSCGVFCFGVGTAAVLNVLNLLSEAYLRLITDIVIAHLLAVGLYVTYRNWKLGKNSPYYVGKAEK